MENKDIKNAILQLDWNILTLENAVKLIDNIPTAAEIAHIKDWLQQPDHDVKHLDSVDQFFLEVSDIPQLEERMRIIVFKLEFPVKQEDFKPSILKVKKAVQEVQFSGKNFLKLLEVILAVGNFLNAGTARGGADAIQLSSLSKIMETRSGDNSTSLLAYLIKLVNKNYHQIANWTREISSVKYATKVSWATVTTEMAKIRQQLTTLQAQIGTIKKCESSKYDQFSEVIPEAFEAIKKDFEALDTLFKRVEKSYEKVALLYGENSKKTPPEEFFSAINDFMTAYENTARAMRLEEVKRRKEAKKKEEAGKKADAKKRKAEQAARLAARRAERDKDREKRAGERAVRREARRTGGQPASNDAQPTPAQEDSIVPAIQLQDNAADKPAPKQRRALKASARGGIKGLEQKELERKDSAGAEQAEEEIEGLFTSIRSGKTYKKRRLRRQETRRAKLAELERMGSRRDIVSRRSSRYLIASATKNQAQHPYLNNAFLQ